MVSFTFSFNYKFRLKEKMDKLEEFCDDTFMEIVEDAKRNCPSKRVAAKISFIRTGRARGIIKVDHKAAAAIEFGTKPHLIKPKNFGGALRWKSTEKRKNVRNGYAYADHVNHPGTKEQPYLRPAIDSARQKIQNFIKSI